MKVASALKGLTILCHDSKKDRVTKIQSQNNVTFAFIYFYSALQSSTRNSARVNGTIGSNCKKNKSEPKLCGSKTLGRLAHYLVSY